MSNVIAPKRHKIHRETASFQPISGEIIYEILLKLPVLSLLRFKSVSKPWYYLISSSRFVDDHVNLSVMDPYLSRHVIIFKTHTNPYDLMCCPLLPVLSNKPTDAVDLDCCLDFVEWGDEDTANTVVGSCNGLVCVVVGSDQYARVLLLNPATKKCNKLPKLSELSRKYVLFAYYAFGYDKCSNDYKVVAFVGLPSVKRVGKYVTSVEVYSWRTGSWKRIQDFPDDISYQGKTAVVNGRLYMLGRRSSGHFVIVSLDLATEMFTELPLPPDPAGAKLDTTMSLGASGERLCVFRNCNRSHAEFWLMNEHDVKECWTKLASVPFSTNPGLLIGSLVPLFTGSNGKILMEYETLFLALYDLENNSFSRPEIRNINHLSSPKIYIESLVSPHGDSRTEILQ